MRKYDSYKDSGIEWIGEIPKHWSVSRLKFNSKIKTGYTPPMDNSENYSDDGMIWVKPDNLEYFKPILDSKEKISPLGIKEQNIIAKDSVLLCCIGSIGKFGIAGLDLLTNQQICGITFNNSLLPSYGKYLVYVTEEELNKYANGNVVRILNATSLGNIEYPIPVIEEQTAIANYLDQKTNQIDDLIAKKERLIQLLEEERTAIINQAVTKGLDPTVPMKDSGIEWLGEIPEHWEVKRMNFISTKIGDGLHGTPTYVEESVFPFINGNNIGEGVIIITDRTKFVSEEEYKSNQKTFTPNTLLMSINGTIGNLAYYNGESIMLGKSVAYINLESNVNKEFIYYYLKSEIAKDYINMELSGSTIKNLSLYSINKTPIPYPKKEEQIEIVNFIKTKVVEIGKIISKTQQEIELLKEYKTALISEVVTGKVDVRNEKLN
jgi:type I restriction enzyme S subunit